MGQGVGVVLAYSANTDRASTRPLRPYPGSRAELGKLTHTFKIVLADGDLAAQVKGDI